MRCVVLRWEGKCQKMIRYFVAHFERVLWEIDKEGHVRLEIP